MSEKTVVVVFPSLFSLNKINSLVSSISTILKAKKQIFRRIEKKDSIIIVEAKDPVFASTMINSLFGIEKVAIAIEIENNFNSVISAIAKVGVNLILSGERFYIKVDGNASAYMPKDVELAATSLLIEKTINLQAKPGTEKNHDKIIYTYLTKSYAYVCIFMDKGSGGIPYKSQKETILCCLYDELSIISCLQTIKMGFDVKILVCYRNDSELLNLVKMMNLVLPRISQTTAELSFYKLDMKFSGNSGLLFRIAVITEILSYIATKAK
ncbi:MAG TPA: thiamine biosynthesis protein, partial [Nitrosopumilaceae archaeon]|nr:thiamine biosynthesis protein [Nitrosopumilaceae archaeon]